MLKSVTDGGSILARIASCVQDSRLLIDEDALIAAEAVRFSFDLVSFLPQNVHRLVRNTRLDKQRTAS